LKKYDILMRGIYDDIGILREYKDIGHIPFWVLIA